MQYRASFFLMALGQFLASFTAFLTIYFMMTRFHSIAGYTYAEVLLCFAAVLLSFSLAEGFGRGFDTFAQMLGNGEFDRMLLRPRGVIFQVFAGKVEFSRVGRTVQAALVLLYALPASGVAWTLPRALCYALMIACGTGFFCALFLLNAGLCFFTTEGLEAVNIFTDGGREFGRYPFSVYGEGALRFLTYVVPMALFQVLPLDFVLGRSDNAWLLLLPPLSLAFAVPCLAVFRAGLRRYRSTGS